MSGNRVTVNTSLGEFEIELYPDKCPKTVANFLKYVDDGFYDGLIFHRVIDGFMAQGGGFEPGMSQKKTGKPVENEAATGVKNARGTIAMARTSDPHSATCQFFVNLKDNDFLNRSGDAPQQAGYCAFGTVVSGMEVVDKMAKAKTGSVNGFDNVPAEDIVIKSVKRAK